MSDCCKILIIDDEFIMRQGLKHMLDWEKEGFEVVGEASNGNEGLKMVEELSPHIILCDIVMPVMDGMDFCNIIQKVYPNIQIIILSGYDKFEYVKSTLLSGAVDYVLKPTLNPEQLLAILNKAMQKHPDFKGTRGVSNGKISNKKVLENILLGNEKSPMPELISYFSNTYFRVMAFHIKKRNENGQELFTDLYEQTEQFLRKIDYCKNILLVMQSEIACVVLNYSAAKEELIKEDVKRLSEQLCMIYPKFFSVLSRSVTNINELQECCINEVLPASGLAFYFEKEHIRLLDAKEELATVNEKFDYSRYSAFLSQKNYIEAIDMLEVYVKLALETKCDEYRLKNQTKNMLYNYLECMKVEEDEKEKLRYDFFRLIDETNYAEGFLQVFSEIMAVLRGAIGQEVSKDNKTIRQILKYIRENYNKELDLAEIADVFNFNYFYLSAYFNRHMLESFSDYLNRIRIEQACLLLKDNKLPIARISETVGYSDHSYFCRIFKKITGITPSEFRREKG